MLTSLIYNSPYDICKDKLIGEGGYAEVYKEQLENG